MNRLLREFRLVPVLLLATVCLLALKVGGLVTSGGYTLASPRQALANDLRPLPPENGRSWAREVLGFPEVTGSVEKPNGSEPENGKPAGNEPAKPPVAVPPPPRPEGRPVLLENGRTQSPAERACSNACRSAARSSSSARASSTSAKA